MTEKEKQQAGELYNAADKELAKKLKLYTKTFRRC